MSTSPRSGRKVRIPGARGGSAQREATRRTYKVWLRQTWHVGLLYLSYISLSFIISIFIFLIINVHILHFFMHHFRMLHFRMLSFFISRSK
jgi:hypothetical protein